MVALRIAAVTVSAGSPRAAAMRSTCRSAASSVMCGSSPEAEAVAISDGTGRGPKAAARSLTCATSAAEDGPRFEPVEAAAL